MKRVYILRGLPGMGKSTVAKLLLAEVAGDVFEITDVGTICSADDYFVGTDGVYRWYQAGLREAHAQCEEKFLKALRDAEPLIPSVIVVDNTNIRHKDYAFYKKAALETGYEVFVLAVGELDVQASFERNKHGVPLETIQRMKDRWQP